MQILFVEDDTQLAEGLVTTLRREGFAVNHVANGKDALLAAKTGNPDIILLDLGLPDTDGLTLLSTLRSRKVQTPVLILTARDDLETKVRGLDSGADDYLVKPFELGELLARLRVLERRLNLVTTSYIDIGTVRLDTSTHQVTENGKELSLSRREYMLLKALMENTGKIQSREGLEDKLYSWGEEVASNAVEVHIHNLRKKLPEGFIHTVRGVGYTIKST